MLSFDHLCAGYGGAPVLRDVSFRLTPHTFTAVVGKNGSGKSTLVSCVNQRLRYTGTISFSGRSLALMRPAERAQTVAILPQTLTSPHITVKELVSFGRSPYLDIGRRMTPADRQAVDAAMQSAGAEGLRDKMADRLSGGERQKAFLAMVLAQDTRVIVLDEPTTYMDMEVEAAFLRLLQTLKSRRKKSLLVIMHNLTQAVRHADNIVVLHGGGVRFDGSTEQCLQSGVLEEVFHVRKHVTTEQGEPMVFFSPAQS